MSPGHHIHIYCLLVSSVIVNKLIKKRNKKIIGYLYEHPLSPSKQTIKNLIIIIIIIIIIIK